MSRSRQLVETLAGIVGPEHVQTDPDVIAGAVQDWTGRFRGEARAVVRPGSTAEVAQVLAACSNAGVPFVPQGGNTGLVAGAIPTPVSDPDQVPVIVSTTRMTAITDVDAQAGELVAEAGATLAQVQAAARSAGWEYGVDLAARDSATIGGTVATNAGGIRVVAYGMTRAQVLGIEAVLPDGRVIEHLAGLPKDNTGYDLGGLLIGSEGTLGVVTRVRLALHRPVVKRTVAMVGCASVEQAQLLVRAQQHAGLRLLAAELIDRLGMHLVEQQFGLEWPLQREWPYVLLLEVAGDELALDGLAADGSPHAGTSEDAGHGRAVRAPAGPGAGPGAEWAEEDLDAVLALDAADAARLWRYREEQTNAVQHLPGVIHKLDVSIPHGRIAEFLDALPRTVEAVARTRGMDVPQFTVFGHLGDANLHLEISGFAADDAEIDDAVFALVAGFGGSISAEHGIGRAKAYALHLSRSANEIAVMRAIKDAIDPQHLANPGAVLLAE